MKYKSCNMIEHGMIFTCSDIQHCCIYKANDGKNIIFNKYFTDKDFSIERVLEQKKEIRENFKKGIIFDGCLNCHNLEEKDWDDDDYIKYIYVSHWTKCNCNCFYCYYDNNKMYFQKFRNKKLLPLLKEMKKKNQLKTDGHFIITGGEPTELDELDSIISFALNLNIHMYLNSSGIKFKKSIAQALKKDKIDVTISLDSSDSVMYKKIKRTNTYDKVINTIKQYVSSQGERKDAVRLKYIILPNVNDNKEEIEKWLLLCYQLNVKKVILDVQTQFYELWKNNIPDYIKELINYFKIRAKELDMDIDLYSYAAQINFEENK